MTKTISSQAILDSSNLNFANNPQLQNKNNIIFKQALANQGISADATKFSEEEAEHIRRELNNIVYAAGELPNFIGDEETLQTDEIELDDYRRKWLNNIPFFNNLVDELLIPNQDVSRSEIFTIIDQVLIQLNLKNYIHNKKSLTDQNIVDFKAALKFVFDERGIKYKIEPEEKKFATTSRKAARNFLRHITRGALVKDGIQGMHYADCLAMIEECILTEKSPELLQALREEVKIIFRNAANWMIEESSSAPFTDNVYPNHDDVSSYKKFLPKSMQRAYEAHIHNYAGRSSALILKGNIHQENTSRWREFRSDLKEGINCVLFPLLYMDFYMELRARKFSEEHPWLIKPVALLGKMLSALIKISLVSVVFLLSGLVSTIKTSVRSAVNIESDYQIKPTLDHPVMAGGSPTKSLMKRGISINKKSLEETKAPEQEEKNNEFKQPLLGSHTSSISPSTHLIHPTF